MSEPQKKRRSRVKTGCLGVVALGGLVLLWAAGLAGTAYWRGQNEQIERREISVPSAAASRDATAGGRVVLDFSVGYFKIVPGAPGEPVRVAAEFDTRSYMLREEFERHAGSRWTYHVTFEETSWFKDGGLRAVLGGSFPEITVYLPPDVSLELQGTFGKGAAQADLGGLWLTDIDLEFESVYFGERKVLNLFADDKNTHNTVVSP